LRDAYKQRGVRRGASLLARLDVTPAKCACQTAKNLHMPFDEWRNDRQSFSEGACRVGMLLRLRKSVS
jgi:hypothetical protein